jgi:hypothetical protein
MVVSENEFFTLTYQVLGERIDLVWTRLFAPSRRLRPVLGEAAAFLRAHPPRRWLSDHSFMKVIAPEDVDWIVDEWLPIWCEPNSMKRAAFVRSTDYFGGRATASLVRRIAQRCPRLPLELFATREEAEQWVR